MAGEAVTYSAVVALDTIIVVAHRRRTAEISSLTKERRQKITKTDVSMKLCHMKLDVLLVF
jgi:hypothetical protein